MNDTFDKWVCSCGARKGQSTAGPQLKHPQYEAKDVWFCPHCDRSTHPPVTGKGQCPNCDRYGAVRR